ncbi:hypothetical protein U879_05190 [Defluviimonas sp. 20V17]|uniref:Catechol 2,3-dioxygenase n=1 Tax=Allgaiera indica TaxID=765699 RepID=A0AAN4ZXV9_9RHOB|nr:VOC family protein [Allgaiera indica]KDB04724.1 hypothetical protein U879_05190 [Defluviimonas sp. 20V17]GHD99090.1 hypothetical protein GCM10008024_05220 [Allgaiera indica]SDW00701.1 Catechol 2,3-dioxygenase [Allgaiera indica]
MARDAPGLARFYAGVFGCKERRPPRRLLGTAVARGNGLPRVGLLSVWLTLPGVEAPFLEIHQYDRAVDRPPPAVNAPGYGHISFAVDDIRETRAAILGAGGRAQGEITDLGVAGAPVLVVYMRDPEGNLVEIEEARAGTTP